MEIKIDARGELCPKPVIMTKKELDKLTTGAVTTIVDNEVAKENISKLAGGMGLKFTIDKAKEDEFYIKIIKDGINIESDPVKKSNLEDLTIAFSSNVMGGKSRELGEILIKSFIFTVSETKPYPSTMVFYNEGVRLTCEGSPVLEDLEELKGEGVEIVSCGTCLDYLDLKDKLKIGSISNMYTIYEAMKKPSKNITIG